MVSSGTAPVSGRWPPALPTQPDPTLLVASSGTTPVSGRWPPALPTQLLVVTRGTVPVIGRWLALPTKPDTTLLLQSGERLINFYIEDTNKLVLLLP